MRKLILVVLLLIGSGYSQSEAKSAECRKIKLAGYQMQVSHEIVENEQEILKAIHKAKQAGADFLITPEGSLSGYRSTFDAEILNSALQNVTQAAKKAKVGLILGTCYKAEVDGAERCWNQVRVYNPKGDFLGAYSKILRCSPIDLPGTGEMCEYVKGHIRTFQWNGLTFGTLICNDLWATPGYTTMPNPYLPLKLKQQGAEFIVHVVNSGLNLRYKAFHESSVELWAGALQMPIVEVNAAKGEKPINAVSGCVSPTGKRDVIVPDKGTQFFICELCIPDKPQ